MADDASACAALAPRGLAHASALSGAVQATRGAARAARHSPRLAVPHHCSLANVAHRSRRLPTKQQSAAPACSGGCGAAAPSPRPVHGAGARRHGPPPVTGRKVRTSQRKHHDAPSAHAALRSAAHGPRHAKPALSLPERLSAEGLASARPPPPRPCPPPGRASNKEADLATPNCTEHLECSHQPHIQGCQGAKKRAQRAG